MARTSKREQLLEAAAVVVRRDGTDRLTLDAVAAQAGVSKGGLLYHFESKRALVAALVDQLIARFGNELVSRTEGETGRGTFSRAYVRASLETADDNATSAALISAVALAPELLDPLREQYRAWSTLLREDGLDRVDALLVRLAVDGLWMADLLGLAPPAPAERKALVERLLAMAGEE
jgi:AcrR family transcriptional regulator